MTLAAGLFPEPLLEFGFGQKVEHLSIGTQTGPPIGVQKGPPFDACEGGRVGCCRAVGAAAGNPVTVAPSV